MSNRSNRPGTELTDSEVASIASLDLLGTTPAGQHIAKDALGNFVNTPDTGGGTTYTFQNGVVESGGIVEIGGQLIQETHIDANGQLFFIEDTVHGSGLTLNTTQVTLVSGGDLGVTSEGTLRQTAATHYELLTPAVYNTTAVVGQVLTLINASTGEAEYQTISGGGNSTIVSLDFGADFTDKAQTVVTGATWVSPTSKITAQVMTPSGVDPDEMILLDLKPIISDIVDGVGFTVTLYSEPEAKGVYNVMCLGN